MKLEAEDILEQESHEGAVLAVHGGAPEIVDQAERVARWGAEELANLSEMVSQGSLFYWNGPQTAKLLKKFREHYPLEYLMPCSSCTAAVQVAVSAAGIAPGDEVIVPPITDMGTVIGILFQQGVPVFADLEPYSYNLDPDDVARKVTSRTKAIVAVHFTGNPCQIEQLREIADNHNLVLIEDCAQAWGAEIAGRPVGTFGHVACYSFNDYKHVSCGDGGMIGTNDARFGLKLQGLADKGYDRTKRSRLSSVLAPNFRISEPQSAVAAAQMDKMRGITQRFHEVGDAIRNGIAGLPGVFPLAVNPESRATYFTSPFRLDLNQFPCGLVEFVQALNAEGVSAGGGLIGLPLYQYPVFQNHNFFGGAWPVRDFGLTTMDYTKVKCPVAEQILKSVVSIEVHPGMDLEYAAAVVRSIKKVVRYFHRSSVEAGDLILAK